MIRDGQDLIPAAIRSKQAAVEAAMNAVIQAGDLATPAMFARVWDLRREYDVAVDAWLWNLETR